MVSFSFRGDWNELGNRMEQYAGPMGFSLFQHGVNDRKASNFYRAVYMDSDNDRMLRIETSDGRNYVFSFTSWQMTGQTKD